MKQKKTETERERERESASEHCLAHWSESISVCAGSMLRAWSEKYAGLLGDHNKEAASLVGGHQRQRLFSSAPAVGALPFIPLTSVSAGSHAQASILQHSDKHTGILLLLIKQRSTIKLSKLRALLQVHERLKSRIVPAKFEKLLLVCSCARCPHCWD